MALHGKVAVVTLGELAHAQSVARRLAAEGATVVLVAGPGEAEAAGRLAADIESNTAGRPAVFTVAPGGDELDGLVEFVSELFSPSSSGGTTSA